MASNLPAIKEMLKNTELSTRIENLVEDSDVFNASLISIVSESNALMACTPKSVIQSALKSVALKLPIDKQFGFAYVVPYGNTAQFQLGYKGYIQLAIRSGQYKTINTVNVYKDEFESYNPVTGEIKIATYNGTLGDRQKGGTTVGYYAFFELNNGFQHSLFIGKSEMLDFAKKYSKAYQYDLSKKKKKSPWSTEFDAMGRKTVLKNILRTYGLLSIDMQNAIVEDGEDEGKAEQLDPQMEVGEPVEKDIVNPI